MDGSNLFAASQISASIRQGLPQMFNPQSNSQFDTSYMTCAAFGSPRASWKLL